MLKRQAMAGSQKRIQLPLWKRLILIAGISLPGGSLAMLIPSQAAYADTSWPRSIFICRAGDGGSGGIANNESNGAAGGAGGSCVNGNKGGDGGAGGDHGSPGGPGGNGGFP
jgi:hypothetical protein